MSLDRAPEPPAATLPQVSIRCYGCLNNFLPPHRRQSTFNLPLQRRASVKDLVESVGVPHTEVDLLLVNGDSVDFSYLVQPGDHISVYPPFASLDISSLTRVRPAPLTEPRFLLDTHLGRLATYLRMLGFDALYRNDYDDDTLVRLQGQDQRVLLTRDRGLLKRRAVTHGYHVWSDHPERQLTEVVQRYGLAARAAPFTRCLRCNSRLKPIDKETVLDRLAPRTRRYYDRFSICPKCDRLYWPGSHYDRMRRLVERLA